MKRRLFIFSVVILGVNSYSFAQLGEIVNPITLTNVSGAPVKLPYIGQKTCILFYIDPDAQKLSDPLTDAIYNQKYPTNKFGAIGVVNCKDTWIPNNAIRSGISKKQKQYPESVLLLDENHTLKHAWKNVDGNDAMIVYVIDKEAFVKYYAIVKSEQEAKAIVTEVIQIIERETTSCYIFPKSR